MQTIPSFFSRKDRILFNLLCFADELRALRSELSILEIEQIKEEFKKLLALIQEK